MILVRLPPLPSSLPRASLVCKRWRRLVSHPHFQRSFLGHRKKAPLLGFFCDVYNPNGIIDFRPTLDPPNRMAAARFSSCLLSPNKILGCHHGRLFALIYSRKPCDLVVWDPITCDRRHIDIPQMFTWKNISFPKGVVVCASWEKGHVHGACHSEPFQVVIIGSSVEGVLACVYSSETCTWGILISLSQPQPQPPDMIPDLTLPADSQSSLVGSSVYWVPVGVRGDVLEFDLHRQNLAIIGKPPDASTVQLHHQYFIMPADGGGLNFIDLSGLSVHVWKRISNGYGVAGWLFETTVELGNILSLKPRVGDIQPILTIVGRDEDENLIFRLFGGGTIYLVHLKTLQFKELSEKIWYCKAHPFSSIYTAGIHPETRMHGDEDL